jgi:transcription antitermination factor NusG
MKNFKGYKMVTKAKKPAAKKAAPVAKTLQDVKIKFQGKVNEAVTITQGPLQGAVGKVQAIEAGGTIVQVLVQGIHNGKPVDSLDTYGPTWLEVV